MNLRYKQWVHAVLTWATSILVNAMVFPVVMYGCWTMKSWTVKKAEHWRIDAFELWMLEKTLESPLDCKEIQPVHSKDQSWVFFGRNDAKAETPVLWPPHVKSWLTGKDSDAGRDWGQEEKGTMEDEMAGWHHRLGGCEFEWTPGVGDGQGGLVCCNSWGCKESDTTEWLNWTELNWTSILGFPGDANGKEPTCQSRKLPYIRKIPWRRACQPILLFLPGDSHGQRGLADL